MHLSAEAVANGFTREVADQTTPLTRRAVLAETGLTQAVTTIQELEQRIADLETEIADLRQQARQGAEQPQEA